MLAFAAAFGVATVAVSQELTLEVMAEGVYAVLSPPGHLAAANTGVVVLEDAVLVIDTRMVPSAALELLAKLHSMTRSVMSRVSATAVKPSMSEPGNGHGWDEW